MNFKMVFAVIAACWALLATNYAAAQGALSNPQASGTGDVRTLQAPTPAAASAAESQAFKDWLMRMHEASKKRSYIGTFVVSANGVMTSAKIWHLCEGEEQIERVEMLTGAPRSIFRHNDRVVTFLPAHKIVRSEKRESLGLFSGLLESADSHIADFYGVRQEGFDRVAGVETSIVTLLPKDKLRFGYRVWTEKKSGLVVKLQTFDLEGRLLEQAAFSELKLDAPVKMENIVQMMEKVEGYRVEKPVLLKTTGEAEGWKLKTPIAGFKALSCYKRPLTKETEATSQGALQWVFSDGLASVSIFIETLDKQRHYRQSTLSLGATQTMTRLLEPYWITVMGEVPLETLQLFANSLERNK